MTDLCRHRRQRAVSEDGSVGIDDENALSLPIIHQREATLGKASRRKAEWDWCLVLAGDSPTDEKRNGLIDSLEWDHDKWYLPFAFKVWYDYLKSSFRIKGNN